MAQIEEEGEHHRPNPWETLSPAQGSQPQDDNKWNLSKEWDKSLNNDSKWKSDGWDTSSGWNDNKWKSDGRNTSSGWNDNKWKSDGQDTSSGRKEPAPCTRNRFSRCSRSRNVRSSKSPRGDLRELIDRGANWHEESLSPAHSGRNAPWGRGGEPRGGKQTGHRASADSHFNETNWVEKHPGNERFTHSLKADISKRQGISPDCNNIIKVKNEIQSGLSAPHNKLTNLSDEKRHNGWHLHSSPRAQSRSRSSSPSYQAEQEVKKSDVEKESDGWGLSSSHVDRSRQRSLSPWSQAAHKTNEKSDNKGTDGWGAWGTAVHQPDHDAWNQTKSSDLSPNCGSNRGRSGHSASRPRDTSIATEGKWKRTEWDRRYSSEHKRRKTGQHPERSKCSEHGVSPENRPSRTEWVRGRSRGRGRSLSRFNRNEGKHPTDTNNTRDEREKKIGFSSAERNCSDLNKNTGCDGRSPTSPNVDSFRSKSLSQWAQVVQESTQNASQKEPDGWGQNSSPVRTSRSRSMSPWSKAAPDINKNYNDKDTDGWGTALDQTANDAWNEPRSNLSPDHGFKRRGWESRHESRSPAPKLGRAGGYLDRSRGRDNSYSPESRHRRFGQIRGGSRYRGRGRTNSPYRCQNRSRRSPNLQRRDPSYSPIGRSRRMSNLQRNPSYVLRMDENREKMNGSEAGYDKKTNNDEDKAAKVTSWEEAKWHDWSVNAFRSSVKDPNLILNSCGPTNTGDGNNSGANHIMTLHPEMQSNTKWTVPVVGGNTMAIPDAHCERKQSGVVIEETFSHDLQIASQNYGDVKAVKNPPGIVHSMDGTAYLPLSYDPWDNDACIASSHANSTLPVNPAASQTLSNQQNPILVSSLASNIFQTAPWSSLTNMLQTSSNSTWGPSTAPFKYPTLEPKMSIANNSSFSNCGGTKSNLVPIGGGPPHMSMLNAPTVSNGIDGVTAPATLAQFVANLPPLTSSGIISSTPSAVPETIFSNSDAAKKITLCGDTMKTSYSRGTVTEDKLSASNPVGYTSEDPKVGRPQNDQNASIARFSKPNTDTVTQPISCADMEGTSGTTESEAKSESSDVNPVGPTPEVPKLSSQLNQNPTLVIGMPKRERTGEADDHSFQWALVGFAKPKLKPFWLKRHLTDANYREVLDKFVKNVTRTLGTSAPQTNENSYDYVKKQDHSLSNLLKDYLLRYMCAGIIDNMRYDQKNETSLVFPRWQSKNCVQ